jgi:hypothetical protein
LILLAQSLQSLIILEAPHSAAPSAEVPTPTAIVVCVGSRGPSPETPAPVVIKHPPIFLTPSINLSEGRRALPPMGPGLNGCRAGADPSREISKHVRKDCLPLHAVVPVVMRDITTPGSPHHRGPCAWDPSLGSHQATASLTICCWRRRGDAAEGIMGACSRSLDCQCIDHTSPDISSLL